jgi:DNA-binding protein HU-beta
VDKEARELYDEAEHRRLTPAEEARLPTSRVKIGPRVRKRKTMSVKNMVDNIAAQFGLSDAQARRLVNKASVAIAQALAKKGKVTLRGVGTFTIVRRPAGVFRLPQSDREIYLSAAKRVKFKPAGKLKEKVEGKTEKAQ